MSAEERSPKRKLPTDEQTPKPPAKRHCKTGDFKKVILRVVVHRLDASVTLPALILSPSDDTPWTPDGTFCGTRLILPASSVLHSTEVFRLARNALENIPDTGTLAVEEKYLDSIVDEVKFFRFTRSETANFTSLAAMNKELCQAYDVPIFSRQTPIENKSIVGRLSAILTPLSKFPPSLIRLVVQMADMLQLPECNRFRNFPQQHTEDAAKAHCKSCKQLDCIRYWQSVHFESKWCVDCRFANIITDVCTSCGAMFCRTCAFALKNKPCSTCVLDSRLFASNADPKSISSPDSW